MSAVVQRHAAPLLFDDEMHCSISDVGHHAHAQTGDPIALVMSRTNGHGVLDFDDESRMTARRGQGRQARLRVIRVR